MTTGINCRACKKETELSVIEGFFKCVNPVCKDYQQHVAKDVEYYKSLQGSKDIENFTVSPLLSKHRKSIARFTRWTRF